MKLKDIKKTKTISRLHFEKDFCVPLTAKITDFRGPKIHKNFLECKRSQSIFGISFSVMFSIILIVFFIAAAFMAIDFFLGIQKQASTGLFLTELQNEVDNAWAAGEYANAKFESALPAGIEYVCLINMSAGLSSDADAKEKEIFRDIKYGNYENNLVFWPVAKAGSMSHNKIGHIRLPDENPHCVAVENGKAVLSIKKEFADALVRVE